MADALTVAPPPGPGRLDGLTRACWITLPRRAAARGWASLAGVLSDGHSLAAMGPVAGYLSVTVLVGGFIVGAGHPGFETVFVESTTLTFLVVALGALSAQWGLAATAGFAVGDFFVHHTAWTTESSFGGASGVLDQPFLANLLVVRLPLLVGYGLLGAVAVGVPIAARALAGSVALHPRLPAGLRLLVGAGLTAATAFLLARLWAAAMPVTIRPLYTWTVDGGFGGGSMPGEAVVPDQSAEVTVGWIAALATLGRALLTTVLSRSYAPELDEVEDELLAPFDTPPPARNPYTTVVRMLAAALVGVLLLAGLIEELWAAGALALVFVLAQLLQSGDIPLPPAAWRRLVDRVPMLLRFTAVLVVVNAVAEEVVGRAITEGSFQVMVWPIALSVLAMAILVPDPASVEAEAEPEAF
jgi:hypothetical protein